MQLEGKAENFVSSHVKTHHCFVEADKRHFLNSNDQRAGDVKLLEAHWTEHSIRQSVQVRGRRDGLDKESLKDMEGEGVWNIDAKSAVNWTLEQSMEI